MNYKLKDDLEHHELIGARIACKRLQKILMPKTAERMQLDSLIQQIEISISRCEKLRRYQSARDFAKNGCEFG
jgi:RNase P subunit RPR2